MCGRHASSQAVLLWFLIPRLIADEILGLIKDFNQRVLHEFLFEDFHYRSHFTKVFVRRQNDRLISAPAGRAIALRLATLAVSVRGSWSKRKEGDNTCTDQRFHGRLFSAPTKIALGSIMWTPLLPSTSCVMWRSAATLASM